MKNSDISELYNAISSLKHKKLPISVSFILSRDMKKMEDIVDELEKSRIKILEKYGDRDDEGNLIINDKDQVKIQNDKIDNYTEEMDALMSYEPYIILDTIPMVDIEKCDTDKYDSLTFEEVCSIERIIAEKNPEEPPL